MATQWGFECWCSPDGGLDYNRHSEMIGADAVCDMPCMGDEVRAKCKLPSYCLGFPPAVCFAKNSPLHRGWPAVRMREDITGRDCRILPRRQACESSTNDERRTHTRVLLTHITPTPPLEQVISNVHTVVFPSLRSLASFTVDALKVVRTKKQNTCEARCIRARPKGVDNVEATQLPPITGNETCV